MANSANPFNPNQPIDPHYFQGRMSEVKKTLTALVQTRNDKTQHILMTGERGIGKTSLAIYARYLAMEPNNTLKTDFHFATAYYTVERGQSLADVCEGLTSKLLESVGQNIAEKCFEKLKSLKLHFGVHVPGIGQICVDADREKHAKTRLYGDFEKAVRESWETIKETHNGILLIIDEIHNLESFDGVGAFFKVVSEAWAVDGYRNAMFAVIGLPKISADISKDDPSAPRIFTYVELARMTKEESLAVIRRCLSETSKTIDDDAANWLAKTTGGYPFFLHQVAFDSFDVDTDGKIDMEDVGAGVLRSLIQFERMVFGKLYKSVEGKQKQKIVDALAEHFDTPQSAAALEKLLKIQNIHQYLRPLEKDGIVEKVSSRFRLSSELLSIYVQIFKTIPHQKRPSGSESTAV
jgi:DNA polymerase III delta prime subunit